VVWTRIVIPFFFCLLFSRSIISQEKNDNNQSNVIKVTSDSYDSESVLSDESVDFASIENGHNTLLSDILASQRGMYVQKFGAPGSFSSVIIRGLDGMRNTFYINGVSLNDAGGAGLNIENVSTGMFKSADIYLGYTPLALPGINLGSSINLHPPIAEKESSFITVESHVNTLYNGGIALGVGIPHFIQYIKLEGGENRYNYRNDNGTPFFNSSDDYIAQRKNEGYFYQGYTGIIDYSTNRSRIHFFTDIFHKKRGIAGPSGAPLDAVSLDETRILVKVADTFSHSERVVWNSSLSFSYNQMEIQDPSHELSFGIKEGKRRVFREEFSINPLVFFDREKIKFEYSLSPSLNTILKSGKVYGNRAELVNGISAEYSKNYFYKYTAEGKLYSVYDKPDSALSGRLIIPETVPARYFNLPVFFARASIYPLNILSLFSGISTDKNAAEIFVSYGHTSRFPSLNESYGDGSVTLPNFDLLPEKAQTLSGGLKKEKKEVSWSYAAEIYYYITHAQNFIVFYQNSSQTILAENTGSAFINGFEASLELAQKKNIINRWRYTYMEAIDKGNLDYYYGKYLPYRPRHQFYSYLETGFSRLRFFSQFSWSGALYRDRYNSFMNYLADRYMLDCGLTFSGQEDESYKIYLNIKNVLNRYQVDMINYPVPGRYYELKINKKFLMLRRK